MPSIKGYSSKSESEAKKKAGHSMSEMECKICESNACKYSEGGEVKGVHTSDMEVEHPDNKMEKKWAGESTAGRLYGEKDIRGSRAVKTAAGQHHRVLGEMKAMPNPKLHGLAEGGEVDMDGDMDSSMDGDLMDACAGELLKGIENKNKKEILESLKALILSCKE